MQCKAVWNDTEVSDDSGKSANIGPVGVHSTLRGPEKMFLDLSREHAYEGSLHSARTHLASYSNYEVIEEYPGDKYLPSYLIYSEFQGEQIHILFAIDTEADNVRIITAYRPSTTQWEEDLKTRRVSP